MPKSRYSLLDVIASKRDLLTCVGYRVNNIYDINAKTYAIKLHQSGTEAGKIGSTKKLLLLESGVRFHLTSFTRDKSDNPSPFTMKLRKHLRGKRLVDVQQLGMDRVVCFTFGSGEASYHLILELYDKGNIILCDYQYEILGLLRSHTFDNETRVANRQIYPLFNDTVVRSKQSMATTTSSVQEGNGEIENEFEPSVTPRRSKESGSGSGSDERHENDVDTTSIDDANKSVNAVHDVETSTVTAADVPWNATRLFDWITSFVEQKEEAGNDAATKKTKKKKKAFSLKQILSKRGAPYDVDRYGPDIVEHCLWKASTDEEEIQPNRKLIKNEWTLSLKICQNILIMLQLEPEKIVDELLGKLRSTAKMINDNENGNDNEIPSKHSKGYILYQTISSAATASGNINSTPDVTTTTNNDDANSTNNSIQMYMGFTPIVLKQHEALSILTFPSFDKAADEYFAKIETQKAQKRHQSAEKSVHTKLENMKELQKQRVLSLVKESDTYEKHALAIECNVENVQNAILVVNSLLANGMEWEQMNDVVQQEKKNGNPIALMISALNLDTNTMYLLLPKDDEEEGTGDGMEEGKGDAMAKGDNDEEEEDMEEADEGEMKSNTSKSQEN